MNRREKERKSEADSVLSAEPDRGLDPMSVRSQPRMKQSWMLNHLRHPGTPSILASLLSNAHGTHFHAQ